MEYKSTITRNVVTGSIVLELLAKNEDTLLSDLINDEGNAAPPEWEPCWCGTRPTCDATSGIIHTRAALIVSISRQVLHLDQSTVPPRVLGTTKNTALIRGDSTLHCHGKKYHLRCIVQHVGSEPTCGHYVAFVRLSNDTFVIYDDEATRYCNTIPDEVWQNARLFAYEEIAEPSDFLSVQQAVCEELRPSTAVPDDNKTKQVDVPEATPATQHPRDTEDQTVRELIPLNNGSDRVHADAMELLRKYTANEDCIGFLAGLPHYVDYCETAESLHSCTATLEQALTSLCAQHINSAAALHTLPYIGDTAYYPLVVIAHALMLAYGHPPTFFIDAVYTLCGSIINKSLNVRLGKYTCKSRHWFNGVAGAGQGKSPTVKPLVKLLKHVLQKVPALAPGSQKEGFHMCQSSTTAAAIAQLRAAQAYLLMHSDDAGRCVSLAFAAGGRHDKGEHVDLSYFLDAAHGDEFSHQTCKDRQDLFKRKIINPEDPVPVPETMCLDPTNVHILWLAQELYFVKYWALLATTKPIGLVQRLLFSFGSKKTLKNVAWNSFFEDVVAPMVERLFTVVLQQVGPHSPLKVSSMELSAEQMVVAADIEETLQMFSQRSDLTHCLRDAMPKANYWLGTALLGNWVVETCMSSVFKPGFCPTWEPQVSNKLFLACVHFVHRRYIYGQSVLATCVREQAWNGFDVARNDHSGQLTRDVVRVLRTCAGARIDKQCVLETDIHLRRFMEKGNSEHRAQADANLEQVLQTIVDLGLGLPVFDSDGKWQAVHKFKFQSLSPAAIQWLTKERVLHSLFVYGQDARQEIPGEALQYWNTVYIA